MTYAAICIPEFPIASWLYNAPCLETRPLVLLSGVPPQEAVASINTLAQAAGIECGMSKVQAEATCDACFRSLDSEQEIHAFGVVLELARRFSPRVQAISTPLNEYAGQERLAAAVLLDGTGTSLLFGSPQAYAQRLHQEFRTLGFENGVAVAPNAQAALMLSRYRQGVTCVQQSDLQECLAKLPTTSFICEPELHTLLHRWGISTLGQLAALPRTELISRLGQQGLRLQQLARGEASHLFVSEETTFALAESVELDTPANDLEHLLFMLSRMLGNIVHKALTHASAVRYLTASFILSPTHTHMVRVSPVHPSQSKENLLSLLRLELQAHPPQAEVLALTVEACAAKPQVVQRGLFQSQLPHPDQLDLLLARLRSITGEQNVGSAAIANSHREGDFHAQPFRPSNNNREPQSTSSRIALRMLRPPQVVSVRTYNDCPHTLIWKGKQFSIVEVSGPWNSSGSWWNETRFNCDYWDVVTEPAYMFRLQQSYTSDEWRLVGLYD